MEEQAQEPQPAAESQPPSEEADTSAPKVAEQNGDAGEVVGSAAMRPVFLGNLKPNYTAESVEEIFSRPITPPSTEEGSFTPIPVARVDTKRGYCFVFLKDAATQADKDMTERFVAVINGMEVENVSVALRAEFARGDGRIKKKEDDRRKNIQPSETLFVVNFHEETTKREDLQMLFEPFGELVRIDMKRNYAFVQFRTVDMATRAKNEINGGKLDQSVLTVEYVARQRSDNDNRRRRDRGDRRGGDRRGGSDRFRGAPPDRFDRGGGSRYNDRERYDDFRGGGRDDYARGRGRERSPGGYRGGSPDAYGGTATRGYRSGSPGRIGGSGGGYRRSRSRSRSPPRGYRSRSPPRGSRYDRFDERGRYDDRRFSPENSRVRGRSPDREMYRGGGRDDRGYRP